MESWYATPATNFSGASTIERPMVKQITPSVAAATATEGEPLSDKDCCSFFLTVGDLLQLLSALAAAFPQAALMLQRTVSNRAGAFATQFLLRAVVPAPRHTPPLSIHPATGAPQTSPSTRAHLRVVRAAQTGARLLVAGLDAVARHPVAAVPRRARAGGRRAPWCRTRRGSPRDRP